MWAGGSAEPVGRRRAPIRQLRRGGARRSRHPLRGQQVDGTHVALVHGRREQRQRAGVDLGADLLLLGQRRRRRWRSADELRHAQPALLLRGPASPDQGRHGRGLVGRLRPRRLRPSLLDGRLLLLAPCVVEVPGLRLHEHLRPPRALPLRLGLGGDLRHLPLLGGDTLGLGLAVQLAPDLVDALGRRLLPPDGHLAQPRAASGRGGPHHPLLLVHRHGAEGVGHEHVAGLPERRLPAEVYPPRVHDEEVVSNLPAEGVRAVDVVPELDARQVPLNDPLEVDDRVDQLAEPLRHLGKVRDVVARQGHLLEVEALGAEGPHRAVLVEEVVLLQVRRGQVVPLRGP
mmetsp:Transcript_36309/g.101412  ORF Transcript_36309/g.101412 Transcript_36309/m.101412 type:complete len:344 (-) Transcript_36309:107-1138(-)